MESAKGFLSKLNWNGRPAKLALSFVVPLVGMTLVSPGVFGEIDPYDRQQKFKKSNKIPIANALMHGVLFGFIMFLFVYFYILKSESK